MNYRKRLKILPGLYLNISKSGVSTTIGKKGASINMGNKGTYVNTGISGTGLYNRRKISTGNEQVKTPHVSATSCLFRLVIVSFEIICILLGIAFLFQGSILYALGFISIFVLLFCYDCYLYNKSSTREKKTKDVDVANGQSFNKQSSAPQQSVADSDVLVKKVTEDVMKDLFK